MENFTWIVYLCAVLTYAFANEINNIKGVSESSEISERSSDDLHNGPEKISITSGLPMNSLTSTTEALESKQNSLEAVSNKTPISGKRKNKLKASTVNKIPSSSETDDKLENDELESKPKTARCKGKGKKGWGGKKWKGKK